ncbi:MAG TPA: multicopper oxidase domain-containing protein, partial [Burkholderiaceae bacterium]|nr:multicopper oxidase domain-containing protein [Burkholderiaceae bacterium]
TFKYHPHADEMVQMAMGMYGMWITHPRDPKFMPIDRDFAIMLAAFDIEPGSATPRINTMLDFNLFTMNTRVFPGIDVMPVRLNDRVRIRVGNLSMDDHPMHLHGHEFVVAGTDGGWTRPESRWPEVTANVGVGQMRAFEFVADEPGDWAFHCHKSHHTMNAMGHDVPTMIGVDHRGLVKKITRLIPDYMVMGERGMADMAEMEMPLPDNTLPMMAGQGPFGAAEMGGMFTIVKVRAEQRRGDYSDPGWYSHPPGTVAYEWTGPLAEPARFASEGGHAMPMSNAGAMPSEVRVRKPNGRNGHRH